MQDGARVYDLHNLESMRYIETPPNPSGVAALSVGQGSDAESVLALPCRGDAGTISVHSTVVSGVERGLETALALHRGEEGGEVRR